MLRLFLEGWSNRYLPLLELLEPRFQPGCLVRTDNAGFASARSFRQHAGAPGSPYLTTRLKTDKGIMAGSCYLP